VTATDIRRPEPSAPAPAHFSRAADEVVNWRTSVAFIAVHFLPLLAFVTGITWTAVVLFVATYLGRMFFVTAGYHRYFAHRSYKLGRVAQFVMAFGGASAAQKGPLWWAGHHRAHHRNADTNLDIHSPKRGFWWSHVGWILCDKYNETPEHDIKDFARFPELRWLNKHDWIAPWTLAIACFVIGGWSGLVVGFFASTVVLWHSTFVVNSLAHVFGRRPYATEDTSRNSLLIALLTGGEGWHNNHHRYPSSARQGFRWWQVDTTYYGLRTLEAIGIVRDLRPPPARVLAEARRGRQDGKAASASGGTFDRS
jgi:stearoyl-CoA desaturase (delta-9 desaturase)